MNADLRSAARTAAHLEELKLILDEHFRTAHRSTPDLRNWGGLRCFGETVFVWVWLTMETPTDVKCRIISQVQSPRAKHEHRY